MQLKISRRHLVQSIGLAAPAIMIGGLGKSLAQDAAASTGYTSNTEQSIEAIAQVGRAAQPPVEINWVTGGSGQLMRRIQAEAERPQCDFFWSASASTLGSFKDLFAPYESVHIASILPNLKSPDNIWTASNLHVVVAMINSDQLSGLTKPKTWADLLNPDFKGKIIVADPANSATGYAVLWGVYKLLGEEGLKKLAANVVVSSSSSNVFRGVAQGEYPIGLTYESTAYPYVAGGQTEISLLYPTDGTFLVPEFQVLIKNAPRGEAAKSAFDLLLSKDTQVALLKSDFRRPSRTDIVVSDYVKLPVLEDIKVFATDDVEASSNREAFLQLWQGSLALAK